MTQRQAEGGRGGERDRLRRQKGEIAEHMAVACLHGLGLPLRKLEMPE